MFRNLLSGFGAGWRGAQVLDRPCGGISQLARGTQGPVRIAKHFSRQQHDVCLAAADDVVGLGRGGDESNRSGWDACLAPDAVGKGRLEAGARGYGGMGQITAGGAIHQIDAQLL